MTLEGYDWWGTHISSLYPWNAWFYFINWDREVYQVSASRGHQPQLVDRIHTLIGEIEGPADAQPVMFLRTNPGDGPNYSSACNMKVQSPDGNTSFDLYVLSAKPVTFWWGTVLPASPWDTWFYWAPWNCQVMMISASGGHQPQLASKELADGTITLRVYDGDTPNLGNLGATQVAAPCGNQGYAQYTVTGEVSPEITRSQTWDVAAAAQAVRQIPVGLRASVCTIDQLETCIVSAIQFEEVLECNIFAAVRAEREKTCKILAAVRTEPYLGIGYVAAVGKDFELPVSIGAINQGNPQVRYHLRAACLGESEKSVSIKALVMKSRVNQIMLEMENLWPQEMDLRSTPNSPSEWRDWRKHQLGQ